MTKGRASGVVVETGLGTELGQLLREVGGPNSGRQTQYLRVYMAQLRHKLEQNPSRPRYFVTEPGVGYRLETKE